MLMAAVLCIAALIILLVLFALFVAINVKFTYHDGKADMELSIFGSLIKFRPRAETLSRLAAGRDRDGKRDRHKKGAVGKEDKSDGDKRKKALDGINDIFELIGRVKKTYVKSRPFGRKRFVIKKLTVHIEYSMADAALTGITAGALWSLMYQTFALLSTVASAAKPDFEVKPVYEERFLFNTEAECILRLRIANIIGILLCVIHNYRRQSRSKAIFRKGS